jgi:hypothetical protein
MYNCTTGQDDHRTASELRAAGYQAADDDHAADDLRSDDLLDPEVDQHFRLSPAWRQW